MKDVHEAAKFLGVSESRIRQLMKTGALTGQKVGGTWHVTDNSLEARRATARNGRPTKAQARENAEHYTLMSRTHEVADVRFSRDICRFTSIAVIDWDRVPFALRSYHAKHNLIGTLNDWWNHRAIPDTRADIEARILELEESARSHGNHQRITTATIPLSSLGLSLSDQYWLRPYGSAIRWEDVNFFDNDFELGALEGKDSASIWMNSVGLKSPDNTTDGQLPKRWLLDAERHRILVKGSELYDQEACNELIATRLYRRLLRPYEYVEYRLAHWRDHLVCCSETFLDDDEEFIPALYLYLMRRKPNNIDDFAHYFNVCEELGITEAFSLLEKTLVCDYLLANEDRHWRNFGVIRNVDTLELRPAPIFDTGTCLWSGASISALRNGTYDFTTKPFHADPERQLGLVLDARWYNPRALDGFVDEVHDLIVKHLEWDKRADYVCRGLNERIERLERWCEKMPKPVFYSGSRKIIEEVIEWV